MSETTPATKSPRKPIPLSTKIGVGIIALIALYLATTMWGAGLLRDGTEAPSFTLKVAGQAGDELTLADLKGKVVLLDFWSTTCPPCLKEMKVLEDLYREIDRDDLQIVGVAAGGESLKEIARFAARRKIPYPLLQDKSGIVADAYQVRSLPTLYVIDRDGKISDSQAGYWDKAPLTAALKEAIARPASAN